MEPDNNSASRVKAFRSRLTGQFRRVEAYVTDAEKLEIEKVKQQLGVTTDIAVAGLVRMGLLHYQEQLRREHPPLRSDSSSHGDLTEPLLESTLALKASTFEGVRGAMSGAVACSASASASPGLLFQAEKGITSALSMPPSTFSPFLSTPDSATGANNPIARFFKNRKEIFHD